MIQIIWAISIIGNTFAGLCGVNPTVAGIGIGILIWASNLNIPITGISNIGILITMFIIGTHIDYSVIKAHILDSFLIFLGTIMATIVSVPVIGNLLGTTFFNSACIATAICLSSTILCQQVLYDHMSSVYGQLAIIGTIIQDLIGICLLIFLNFYLSQSPFEINNIGITFLIFIAFGIIYLMRKTIYTFIDQQASHSTKNYYNIFATIVIVTYSISHYLETYYISQEVVFLLLGIFLKKYTEDFANEITMAQMSGLMHLFIVSGFKILSDSIDILHHIKVVLELSFAIIFIKFIINYFALSLKYRETEIVIKTSLLLSSISELVFFVIYLLDISPLTKNILVCSTVISMISIPIIFNILDNIFTSIRRKTVGIARFAARANLQGLTRYIVVVGVNDFSRVLQASISSLLIPIIVIDKDLDTVLSTTQKNVFFIDATNKETYTLLIPKNIHFMVLGFTDIEQIVYVLASLERHKINILVYVICQRKHITRISEFKIAVPIISSNSLEETSEDLLLEVKERFNNTPAI